MAAMRFFDKAETRDQTRRERENFATLRDLLSVARTKAPALKKQLKGIEIETLTDRAALARIPVLRKSDLISLQKAEPPFAGLISVAPSALKRLFMSPGPIFDPESHAPDNWGAGRAFHAAGFGKGDIVLNTFSYHFTPGGLMLESGAHAVKAAVIPAGPGATEQQLDAIAALKPNGYCGTPDFLKILIEKGIEAGRPITSITKALVSGAAFPQALQEWVRARGILACQAYASADLGIIAYQSLGQPGLILNEGLIVEIVKPGTDDPVAEGEVGEVVVTKLDPVYPLLRFGTGDLSKIIPGTSPCGRTNQRLAGWMGRADQRTKIKGMFVDPAQIHAVEKQISKDFPKIGRMRLVVSRLNDQDHMALYVETAEPSDALMDALNAALTATLNLKGQVECVPQESLPKDGKVISDERPA
jgi:phenylacetate-CoA ligase